MSDCEECNAARETQGAHGRFDSLKCIYCAARVIQRCKALKRPREERMARCSQLLAWSVERGLDEKEIRRLIAGPTAYAPNETEKRGKKK